MLTWRKYEINGAVVIENLASNECGVGLIMDVGQNQIQGITFSKSSERIVTWYQETPI